MFELKEKSVEELLHLAEHDPEAQFQLGLHYANGDGGVKRDWTQAVEWSRRAAEQGHPGAQFNLACFYDLGRGLPRDGAKNLSHDQPKKKWLTRRAKVKLSTNCPMAVET